MDVLNFELSEISNAIGSKKVSAAEVTEVFLKKISEQDEDINAFITINEKAIDEARSVDAAIGKGEKLGPLAGIPIGIKDMLCTKGIKTTAGSKILENFIPPYSATVVHRLKEAGAIVLGKCNQDEFAMGSSNETSYFGLCKNPWNKEYVPGGSSGGSAAAVAAGMVPVSIGTDTGGSIRQPASFCNLVGVKPTYGRVSRYGVVAFASSLDQVGTFSKSVKDSALILETICGKDRLDSTTSTQKVPEWSQLLNSNIKGLRVGLPKEYISDGLDEDVKKTLDESLKYLKDAGAEIVDVSLPNTKHSVSVYYLVATCEASSNLARYDGVRFGHRSNFSGKIPDSIEDFYSQTRGEGFGEEVKRRIVLGTYALSSGYYDAYYNKACRVRRLIRDDFEKVFSQCDVILSPVSTTPAFKIGERINDPLTMYMNDIFTTSANLAGIPGLSVPAGFSKDGLPIGVQILAKHFEEEKMLNAALAIEESAKVKQRSPQ